MNDPRPPAPQSDKAQVGLTTKGDANLKTVMELGWFETESDAYRLAIAIAISHDVCAAVEEVAGATTKFNFVGGIDRDGRVRSLITALRVEHATIPARYAERLAHAGLEILASSLADDDAMISDAIRPPLSEES